MRFKQIICYILTIILLFSYIPEVTADEDVLLLGCDVSSYNGAANWTELKNMGVDFVILRCYDAKPDSRFNEYYEGARAAGLAVGAYVYMEKTTVSGAETEAKNVIEFLDGKELDFPLYLDVEEMAVLRQSKLNITNMICAELEIFTAAGYQAGLYISSANYTYCVNISRMEGYSIWLAKWVAGSDYNRKYFGDVYAYSSSKPEYADIWQWTANGNARYYTFTESYVTKNLDLNYCYVDYRKSKETEEERLEREENERLEAEKAEKEAQEKAEREAREAALEIGTELESLEPDDYPDVDCTLTLTAPYTKSLSVAKIQCILRKMNYSVLVNGIYTEDTYDAIVKFQVDNGLTADGEITPKIAALMERLMDYYLGYTSFSVVGDVDGDGLVKATDARILIRYNAGLELLMSQQIDFADANFDGIVTAADARAILRHAAEVEAIEMPVG